MPMFLQLLPTWWNRDSVAATVVVEVDLLDEATMHSLQLGRLHCCVNLQQRRWCQEQLVCRHCPFVGWFFDCCVLFGIASDKKMSIGGGGVEG